MKLSEAIEKYNLTKVEMAEKIGVSGVQLEHLLDSDDDRVTLATLCRAAKVIGRELCLGLV